MRTWYSRVALLMGATSAIAAAGCMQERAAINRVQPDFLDKRDMIPVEYDAITAGGTPETLTPQLVQQEPAFYMQTTVIGKPVTTGFTGLTNYGEVEKIRWEVTENYLIARESYSFVHGAPEGSNIGQSAQTNEVVAIYRIEKHFDIRRDYNSTTGEEINVLDENASDRPWYQRRYMRIDWSQNLVSGYNSPLQYEEWTGHVQSEPAPVVVNNPSDPNAPVFEYQGTGTDRQLSYFDIVNKAILHPETVSFGPDYPNVSACILNDANAVACNPAELTFRVAFRRVDPTRDYQPASLSEPLLTSDQQGAPIDHEPNINMERFGVFDRNRVGFDPTQYGLFDTQHVHFASRHNLWQHHHALAFVPPAANAKGCNFDADCGSGQACQIGNTAHDATNRGLCATIGITHLADATREVSCNADVDCRQTSVGTGVSNSAVCDTVMHRCGEPYFRCSTNADCSGIDPQSTCDTAIATTRNDNRGLCLMPFRQRQVRQVAYHLSPDYPERMMPVTNAIVANWNDAFKTAVTSARRRECQIANSVDGASDDGTGVCNSDAVLGTGTSAGADANFIYVGCHSPVWGTDNGAGQHTAAEVAAAHAAGWDLAVCGSQGTSARLGDLRYHMIGSINEHDANGYWGLANVGGDPETGEMVIGRGAVWQTVTDNRAAFLVMIARIISGDPTATLDNIDSGQYLIDTYHQVGTGSQPSNQVLDAPFASNQALTTLANTPTGIARMRQADAGWLRPNSGMPIVSYTPGQTSALDRTMSRLRQARTVGDGANLGASRWASLAGTELESRLMTDQQSALAPTANVTGGSVPPSALQYASPFRQQSPATRRLVSALRTQLNAYECDYDTAFTDDVIMGLAQRLTSMQPIDHTDPLDAPVSYGRDWNFANTDGTPNYGLMQQYTTQFIHQGVLAHELGHSLGQRHNFTASADTLNYNENYWRVRGRGHHLGVRPRFEYLADPMDGKYYSPEEISGRLEEYAYSSVMDYKGLNEDAHGLGRYDYAYIKNVYTGIVEAFRSVPAANRNTALAFNNSVTGSGTSTPLDLYDWARMNGAGPVHGLHYTQVPQIFGTHTDSTGASVPNIGPEYRFDVFQRETDQDVIPGWGPPPFTNVVNDGDRHLLVPYRFDSDERAGLVWQDQRFDAGADAYESLHYVTSHYLDYYAINSFSRLRTGFSAGTYVSGQASRFLENIKQTTQLLAFDLLTFQDFFSPSSWASFTSDHQGGFVNTATMSMSADALVAMMTMPEIGAHQSQGMSDGTTMLAPGQGTGRTVTIPVNTGRAFESTWRQDAGFWWYEMMNRIGSFYDKTLALEYFADPTLYLLGRSTPTDIRQWQLSYYSMFPDQTTRLFGAILAEDYQDFAPIVTTASASVNRTHLVSLTAPAADRGRTIDSAHQPLDPQTHFTIQQWAAITAIAEFPATYDQSFMESARMWIDGDRNAPTIQDEANNTVSFTNPWTHVTYRALHIGTNAGEQGAGVGASALVHPATGAAATEAGVAARMILHLQDLDFQRLHASSSDRAAQIEQDEKRYIDLFQVMRLLNGAFSNGRIIEQ